MFNGCSKNSGFCVIESDLTTKSAKIFPMLDFVKTQSSQSFVLILTL